MRREGSGERRAEGGERREESETSERIHLGLSIRGKPWRQALEAAFEANHFRL